MTPETPRVLVYDIETAPNISYTWGMYDQNVIKFEQEWFILCFAYKWLDEEETHIVAIPDFRKDFKATPDDDYRVVKKLHELFSAADIVVAHNGNRFDQKRANSRFLYHGMTPPMPYKQIDTCLVARKYFGFNSNKLGDLGQTLGLGAKADTHGFATWLGCMNGDASAWETMKNYNVQDVKLLERIYLRLRPWIEGHPNVATITNRPDACPKCGSEKGMVVRGYICTSVSRRAKYQCKECGGYSSGRTLERLATHYV